MNGAPLLSTLDGTAWRAVRFGSGLATVPPAEVEFSLEIQGDRLAGRSGCNRYMGGWSSEEDALRIGQLASTMMWCDGLMELERAFLDALGAVTGAERRDGRLVLVGEDSTDLVELEPVAPTAG